MVWGRETRADADGLQTASHPCVLGAGGVATWWCSHLAMGRGVRGGEGACPGTVGTAF